MSIWLIMFLNAAGTWVSWLTLGPYISTQSNTLIAFGLMAFIRQILGFIGTRLAEKNTSGNIGKNNLKVEFTLLIVNILAIGLALGDASAIIYWAPIWGAFRYFVGGFSTIYGFQLLSKFSSKETSVVGQLTLTQGSIIVGALLAFLVMKMTPLQSLIVALAFDAFTSLLFIIWLYSKKVISTHHVTQSQPGLLKSSLTMLYRESGFRLGSLFLLSLIILSGLPSMCLYISLTQNRPDLFSILNLIIGVFLLFFSLALSYNWLTKINNFTFMILTLIASMIIYFFSNYLIAFIGVFIVGATWLLLLIHREIMLNAKQDIAVGIRASMALQLNIIFGIGELICCLLVSIQMFSVFVAIKLVALLLFSIIHFNLVKPFPKTNV